MNPTPETPTDPNCERCGCSIRYSCECLPEDPAPNAVPDAAERAAQKILELTFENIHRGNFNRKAIADLIRAELAKDAGAVEPGIDIDITDDEEWGKPGSLRTRNPTPPTEAAREAAREIVNEQYGQFKGSPYGPEFIAMMENRYAEIITRHFPARYREEDVEIVEEPKP